MKKALVILFLVFSAIPLRAQSIQYAYKSSLSSTDLENPKIGNVYTDAKGSLFIVSALVDNAAVLDRIYTSSKITATIAEPLEIYPRFAVITAELQSNLNDAGIRISKTSFLYPLRPALEAGYSFKAKGVYVAGGFCIDLPLIKVVNTPFFLIEDASLEGSFLAGGLFTNPACAYIKWAVSYKCGLGKFVLGAGYGMSHIISDAGYMSFMSTSLSLGVRL